MSAWLFQGNPDVFHMDEYLKLNQFILWSVRQEHLGPRMKVGDTVYLWRAAGSKKAASGVVAKAVIVEQPLVQPDDAAAQGLWIRNPSDRPELRVRLRITQTCLGPKEVVRRDWIAADPVLRDLMVLKMANATNYELAPKHAQRLALLVENTGRTWDREECLAALWAYMQTYKHEVSKLPGSPVAEVALAIGRAVSGVYNKVMNFRSIDPRDSRTGLTSINSVDQSTWDEFFDAKSGSLREAALDAAFKQSWGSLSEPVAGAPTGKTYKDFGEAPDDDPEALAQFAARVRKGQPKFRKNLLQLYNNRCAITGDGPEAVLEAAHIVMHSKSGLNHTSNGLLLRADIHSLFDAGLLKIEPKSLIIALDDSLDGTSYWTLRGRKLRSRLDGSQPSAQRLQARWDNAS
jgi:hypothetical protein